MTEREIERRIRGAAAPDEAEAAERGWRVIRAAHRERGPQPGRTRASATVRPRAAIAAVAAVLVAAAVAVTPPGEAVGEWLQDVVRPGRTPAQPALTSLPAPGRLLVTSPHGPWIVQQDGSRRRLGSYDDAGWSPGGLYVVATSGRQLVALEPDGEVRWSLARRAVSSPAWSPDGLLIAYASGRSLRVVEGDGTPDAVLRREAASVPATWQPGAPHVLAFARPDGRIEAVQADSRARVWLASTGERPVALQWTRDGRRLVALSRRSLVVLDAGGARLGNTALPAGARAQALSVHPSGDSAAVTVRSARGSRSEVLSIPLEGDAREPRRLFAGDGRLAELAWSPNGRWLVVAWPDADQWLFLRSSNVRGLTAVSNVARQFAPGAATGAAEFPRIAGWCCPP